MCWWVGHCWPGMPCWCIHHAACGWSPQVDTEELRKLKRVDAAAISKKKKLTEMDVLAVVQNDSTYLEVNDGYPWGGSLLLQSWG